VVSLQLMLAVVFGRTGKRLQSVWQGKSSDIVRNIQDNERDQRGEAEARRECAEVHHSYLMNVLSEVPPVALHHARDEENAGGERGSLDPHLKESTEGMASSLRSRGPDGETPKIVPKIPGSEGGNVAIARARVQANDSESPISQRSAEQNRPKDLRGNGKRRIGVPGVGHPDPTAHG
jgi:hypothetical protein